MAFQLVIVSCIYGFMNHHITWVDFFPFSLFLGELLIILFFKSCDSKEKYITELLVVILSVTSPNLFHTDVGFG